MDKYCPVLKLIILKNKKSPNGFVLFYYVNSKSIPYLRKDPSPDVSFHMFVAKKFASWYLTYCTATPLSVIIIVSRHDFIVMRNKLHTLTDDSIAIAVYACFFPRIFVEFSKQRDEHRSFNPLHPITIGEMAFSDICILFQWGQSQGDLALWDDDAICYDALDMHTIITKKKTNMVPNQLRYQGQMADKYTVVRIHSMICNGVPKCKKSLVWYPPGP